MTDHIDKTIADFQKKLAEKEDEARQIKVAINQMCSVAGRDSMYSDADLQVKTKASVLRSDEFVGKPLAAAARRALELRKAANQDPPATVREIYECLKDGGYEFDTKNDANAIRALRISLSKNSPVFYKLSSGKFGLVAWYGDKIKRGKKGATDKKDESDDVNDIDDSDDNDIDESEIDDAGLNEEVSNDED